MVPSLRGAVAGAVFAGAVVTGVATVRRVGVGGADAAARARLFDAVLTQVLESYVEPLDAATAYRKAAEGLVRELGDPNSAVLSPERLRRVEEATTGRYAGIGIEMDQREGWLVVVAPFPGSPADRAGLRPGDRVLEVDGRSTQGLTPAEALRAVRGPVGTRVTITVERPGVDLRRTVTLTRDVIQRNPVRQAMLLDDGLGYVRITRFTDSTAAELHESLDSLRRAGMRALLLDLRGNPGGLLTQGTAVADLFLERGDTIVRLDGRHPAARRVVVDSAPQRWADLPIAVLVNEASASAAELVAGALQDNDRAVVVGRTTFGKGSAQGVFPLLDGSGLRLTVAWWSTPAGRGINRPIATPDPDAGADTARPAYRTRGGRTVYGGGGIVPDVVVGDTATPPEVHALSVALGDSVVAFRDAMSAFALRAAPRFPAFDAPVTPALRDAFYATLAPRGVRVDKATFDRAAAQVDRLLGLELARFAFGREAELRRSVLGDETVARAAAVLRRPGG